MLEPGDEHNGKSFKVLLVISIIAPALALILDHFLNTFSELQDYLVYFAISVLLIGVMYFYVVIVSDKRLENLVKSLSQNVKLIEDITNGKLLLPIEEAVRMESQAEEEVFIISRDPTLELNDEFLNVVCRNLTRSNPIKYHYFFPKGDDDPKIERGIKNMVSVIKKFGNGNKITEPLLKKQFSIYRVNFILNNIVIVDPFGKKTDGWIFPNAKFEHHILHADKYLIDTAIRQIRMWMKNVEDKIFPL